MRGVLGYKKRRASISLDDLMALWEKQSGLCAISGVPMTYSKGCGDAGTNISLDQIIPGGGYALGNIQLVCRIVNIMKWNSSDEKFRFWVKKLHSALFGGTA